MEIPEGEASNTKPFSIKIFQSISRLISDLLINLPIGRDPRGLPIDRYPDQYPNKLRSQKERPLIPIPPPIPNKMVAYSVKAINPILLPISQVTGRSTFHTLWQLF